MSKQPSLSKAITNIIWKLENIYLLIEDDGGGSHSIKTPMPTEGADQSILKSTLDQLTTELKAARGILANLRNTYKKEDYKNDSDSDGTESLDSDTSQRAAVIRVEKQIYSEIGSEIESQTELIESQTRLIESQTELIDSQTELIPSQVSSASSTSKDELAELKAQKEEAVEYVNFLENIKLSEGEPALALKQGAESQSDDVNLEERAKKLHDMTLTDPAGATADATKTATDEITRIGKEGQNAVVNAAIDRFIKKVNIVQSVAQSQPQSAVSSGYASAVSSLPPPPSKHATSPMLIDPPSQDVDLDANEMLAIKTITNAVCYGVECVFPSAVKAVNLTLKTAYWTMKAANQNNYSRLLFILLLLVARKESETMTTLTNEFARITWILSKMGVKLTLSATGINAYIPALRAWAAAQVTIYADVVRSIIDNYVTEKIAVFTGDIDALLRKYAEEAAIIAQNMVAGAAQTAALNQLRTTFMDRIFGGAVNAAAGGVASVAMNSILGNIANAAAGGGHLLTGGRKKSKTRRHNKKTRRTRNRKGGKRRSRRIK